MSDITINNLIKFYIILFLYHKPHHGYDMMKKLENRLERKISASHIYPFLSALKTSKLIEIKQTDKREKKTYVLTEKGTDFVINFLHKSSDLLDIAITHKLTECIHCSCKVLKGGYEEVIEQKPLLFCCTHCADAYKSGFL